MENFDTTVPNEISRINYLTPDNVEFSSTKNGFVSAKFNGSDEFVRVHLSRVFPHDLTEEYISVSDDGVNEVGIIKSLSDFCESTSALLRHELDRKYFAAKIFKILNLEEKFGNSTWTIETSHGMRVITLKDTFKSIVRIGEDRALVIDEDANRYEIESLEGLDKHSLRRIELFL